MSSYCLPSVPSSPEVPCLCLSPTASPAPVGHCPRQPPTGHLSLTEFNNSLSISILNCFNKDNQFSSDIYLIQVVTEIKFCVFFFFSFIYNFIEFYADPLLRQLSTRDPRLTCITCTRDRNRNSSIATRNHLVLYFRHSRPSFLIS
jgi:hypothetical protein